MVLADTSVVEPDIVYLANERMSVVSARGTVDPDVRVIDVYRAEAGVYGLADRRPGDLTDLPPFPGLRIDPAELRR